MEEELLQFLRENAPRLYEQVLQERRDYRAEIERLREENDQLQKMVGNRTVAAEHAESAMRIAEHGRERAECKLARLQAEVERLRKEQADFEYNASQIINAAESRLTRLLGAVDKLWPFVRHDSKCMSNYPMHPPQGFNRNKCSCGLDAARERANALIKEARDD